MTARFSVLSARAFVSCACLTACATLTHARTVHVDLRASVKTSVQDVVLADVADISMSDEATIARLSSLAVGRVSGDGKATVVDRVSLARWVTARTGVRSSDIIWGGAPRCSVQLGEPSVDAGAPVIAARMPVDGGRVPPVVSNSRTTRSAVLRGSLVTLRAISGAIAVDSRVEALDDGFVGQDIHVRLPGATEAIVAHITAPGQVEVNQ